MRLTHLKFGTSALTEYTRERRQQTCASSHTCAVCTTHYGNQARQLGAGIRREIRPRWHGSFNEALSRKSRAEASFILCHFSNNVCACGCVCQHISLSAGKRGCFPSSTPPPRPSLRAQASACTASGCQWDSRHSSERLQKRTRSLTHLHTPTRRHCF